MITYIRVIRSTLFGIVPAGSIGNMIEIAWSGAVAVRYGFAPRQKPYDINFKRFYQFQL
jgi:hypothetical protein